MEDVFDYDVFLSFASTDEELVRPVWQELCLSGLRVFWSDAVLKQRLGESWFDSIQSALERSRHLLLIVSVSSMSSEWVKREYQAFYNHCYRPGTRRLIPVLAGQYNVSWLPLFLKQLEAAHLCDRDALRGIIRVLGGANLEELKQSLVAKEGENGKLLHTVSELQSSISSMRSDLEIAKKEKAALAAQLLVAASGTGSATGGPEQPSLRAARETAGAQETVHASVTSTLSEKDVRETVKRAIGETAINIWGNGFNDINSNLVGKKLHALCQGAEIPVLCSMVGEPEQDREKRIKTYLLLKHCSCQKVPMEFVRQALRTFCASLTGGPDANTAAEAIKQIPLPVREKWQELMEVLSSGSDAHFIVECLSMFTPADKRAETGASLCDVLATAMERTLVEACVKALKAFNYREAAADTVTEIMSLGGTLNKSSQLAGLLADWRYVKSMNVVKEVIERWRYSEEDMYSFRALVEAYYRLGGASTASFIADVLAEAPDRLQRDLLYAVPRMSQEADIMRAVALVAQNATSDETIAAAQKLISEHQKQTTQA